MSEPLSSTEIEDVLSSIRRLVSDDLRPAPHAPVGPELGAEKLLLTPSLRVVADAASAQTQPPMMLLKPRLHLTDSQVEPQLDEPQRVEPEVLGRLGDVVASVSAAIDALPGDWEAETGDLAPEAEFRGQIWRPVEEADSAAPQSEAAAAFLAQGHLAQDHFEHHVADVGASEVGGGDAPVPGWAQRDAGDEDGDIVEADVVQAQAEPDAVWAAAAEASVIAALAEPDLPLDLAEDGLANDALDEGLRFDEDVLRELVRDILREELAGKMGERITRNVRKLVRAEIARAMAAQDFD